MVVEVNHHLKSPSYGVNSYDLGDQKQLYIFQPQSGFDLPETPTLG